jgi:hypothetical protein
MSDYGCTSCGTRCASYHVDLSIYQLQGTDVQPARRAGGAHERHHLLH